MVFILAAAVAAAQPLPVIDMHFHALGAADQGPPPTTICAPYENWPILDGSKPIDDYLERFIIHPECTHSIASPKTDAELLARNLAALDRNNVTAVASGTALKVEEIRRRSPHRIIPALHMGETEWPSPGELRALHG